MRSAPHRERGFLVIAAVFLLVVLAGLVAYLTTVATTSQAASAADQNAARAYQAARAGVEWGVYQLLRPPGGATFKSNCDGVTAAATYNLTFGSNLSNFTATVTCSRTSVTEGASTVKSYLLVSTACNLLSGGGICPNTATTIGTYVERRLTLTLAE